MIRLARYEFVDENNLKFDQKRALTSRTASGWNFSVFSDANNTAIDDMLNTKRTKMTKYTPPFLS